MNEEWFIINNIEEFINASRRLIFKNFGTQSDSDIEIDNILTGMSPDDEAEMDDVLSYSESYSIVSAIIKKQINKKTKKYRYVLNEQMYMSIINSLNDRMVSNILNSLVNKGLVETAYDEKTNDFIFWINENDKNKQKYNTD